jgi:hypothetical protein
MKEPFNPLIKNMRRIIKTVIIVFIVIVCILLINPIGSKIEFNSCVKKLSQEYKTTNDYNSVYDAVFLQLKGLFPIGTEKSTVRDTVNSNKSLFIQSMGGDATMDYLEVRKCIFQMNNFSFLFIYSDDGKLLEIREYLWD